MVKFNNDKLKFIFKLFIDFSNKIIEINFQLHLYNDKKAIIANLKIEMPKSN